jgi:S-(hydroxymethyl)glutathione dehydrogenase / alcohol dehydrogenase
MKAAVFHAPNTPLTIENAELARPRRHEILLRTAFADLCHSDLHFREDLCAFPTPAVLSHAESG